MVVADTGDRTTTARTTAKRGRIVVIFTPAEAPRVDFYAAAIALCAVIVFAKFVVHRGRSVTAGPGWRIGHYVCVSLAGLAMAASLCILAWVNGEPPAEQVLRASVLGFAVVSAIILAFDFWSTGQSHTSQAPQPAAISRADVALGLGTALFFAASGLLVVFGVIEARAESPAADVFITLLAFGLAFAAIGAVLLRRLAPRAHPATEPAGVASSRTRAVDASRRAGSAASAADRSANDSTSRIAYVEQTGAWSVDCARAILDAEGNGVGSPRDPIKRAELVEAAYALCRSGAMAIEAAQGVRNQTSTLQDALDLARAASQQATDAVQLLNEQP